MNKISLIGVYPPPVGGASIHIQRLANKLNKLGRLNIVYNFYNKQNNIIGDDFTIKNPSFNCSRLIAMFKLFFDILFYDKSNIIHLHNEETFAPFLYIIYLKTKKKIVFTIHDQMRFERKRNLKFLIRYLCIQFLNLSNTKFIVVNQKLFEQLISFGISSSRINIIPAYLKSENESDYFEESILIFYKKFDIILSIYAFATRKLNGVDMYGIDLALKLLCKLKEDGYSIGLVILLPGYRDKDHFQEYIDYIQQNKLANNILFINESINNTTKLWSMSNIHLRLTNTDGDALTIREALSVGTNVIASDVVVRPEGCITFRNRDLADLVVTTISCIKNLDKNKLDRIIEEDQFIKLMNVYKNNSHEKN